MRKAGQMITGIGAVGTARTVDVQSNAGARTVDTPATTSSKTVDTAEAPSSPATALAAQGAPIDTDKVAAIKAGIANGTYKVDAKAIADRMIALDLPAAK